MDMSSVESLEYSKKIWDRAQSTHFEGGDSLGTSPATVAVVPSVAAAEEVEAAAEAGEGTEG